MSPAVRNFTAHFFPNHSSVSFIFTVRHTDEYSVHEDEMDNRFLCQESDTQIQISITDLPSEA